MKNQAGKGDTLRPVNGDKFRENHGRIFDQRGWLILWHGVDEWEWFSGNRELAGFYATCDGRDTNYGRTGYSLVRCPEEPTPKC